MKIDGGMRDLFRENLVGWHWQSIESGATGGGIPDLNGCCNGRDVWIEMKKTEANAVTFEFGQVGWLLRRTRAGGRCFIAVRRKRDEGPRAPKRDEIFLYYGKDAKEIDRVGLALKPLLWAPGGPARWPWPIIHGHLLGKQKISQ